jgi:hypothetical protein
MRVSVLRHKATVVRPAPQGTSSRRAPRVAKVGNANRFLQIRYRLLLAGSDLMKFLVTDERVGDISKGLLDRLSVGDQSLLVFRLSQVQISPQCASRKDRLAYLRAIGPDAELCGHEAGKDAASTERTATRPG